MSTSLRSRLSVVEGDITRLTVDAIVNAANESLLGGGGVDGAIHRAAGPNLLALCRTLGGCPTGQARLTPGFNLLAKHIVHTVGPVWKGGDAEEDSLLASCYRECLKLASDNGIESIAFPAISTGVYGFPTERAVGIALSEVQAFLVGETTIREVIFCCFDEKTAGLYRNALATG